MRRERRGLKFIIILLVVISILIAILVGKIISNNVKNSRENQFASEMSKLSEELGQSDTVSTEIGKSVEEAKEENSSDELEFQDPEINEENTTIQNDVKTSSTVKDKKENTTTQTNSNIVKENKASTETNSKPEKKEDKKEDKKEEIKFEAPLKGEIIREFAKDSLVFSNTLQEWVTHNGIDIKADKTSVVKAAANGKVSAIKNDPRYGLTVIIEHDNGYKTVYSNLLTAEFVVKGEKVELGQTIGTVGNSASFEVADEYHLHFEVLKDNEYVNPTNFISIK